MPQPMEARICFVGDSFVNGTGDTECLGWAGRVCQIANSKGNRITFYNLGVRGDTSADIKKRWKKEVDPRLSGHKGLMVFSFGVNDTVVANGGVRVPPEESAKNCKAILTAAKKKYPVIMVGPPAVADAAHNQRIAALSAAYAKVAAKAGVPYLDIYTPLSASALWMEEVASHDGAHPDGGGYTLISALVLEWDRWWFR